MKTIIFALLGIASSCVFAQTAMSRNSDKPAIAVPIFENKTGGLVTRKSSSDHVDVIEVERREDQIRAKRTVSNNGTMDVPQAGLQLPDVAAEIATNAVKEALARCGKFRVVDYSPLVEFQINEKRKKENSNGYVVSDLNPVDYLLVGSINNYRVKNEKSVVYGVQRWRNTVTVSMDVKLIQVPSQEVIASKTMSEKLTRDIPEGVTEIEGLNDDWEEPLRKAVSSAVPKFIASINIATNSGEASSTAEPVTFEVKSTPEGADVEYNDSFVGNTPCTVTAPATPGILRVSLAGYKTWEKKLTPNENMRISPVLEKIEKPVIVPKKNH